MIITFSKKAGTGYKKLPSQIQKKANKRFNQLLVDYRHPSLRAKKMGGKDTFEARVDIHYRFTFQVEGEDIYILTIGQHDKGLGKK